MQPIKRRRLYQDIVEQIERRIISGELAIGSQLPSERDLADQLQVGRPSIRQALFTLEKMGLINLRNGERATIVAPTPAALVTELSGAVRYYLSTEIGVHSFQDARIFFEIGLVRHAAKNRSREDLQRLKKALDDNENALGDVERFADTDIVFHLVLAEISGNPVFTTLHGALTEWLRGQRTTSLVAPKASAAAFESHRRIYEAIAAADPDAAEKAMQKHLEQVGGFYWKVREAEGARPA